MIIVDECPYRIVKNEGFEELIHDLVPQFRMPSHFTVMRDYIQLYLVEKG